MSSREPAAGADREGSASTKTLAPFERSWRVGVFTATMRLTPAGDGRPQAITIQWWPSTPRVELWDRKMRRQYRAGRHAAAEAIARSLGGQVVIVELTR